MIPIEEARQDPVYHAIPTAVLQSLYNYIERHQRPGGFVRAVLENNLRAAFQHADRESEKNMAAIVRFVYNHFPSNSYGSWAVVENWIAYIPPGCIACASTPVVDQAMPNHNQFSHPHFDIHGRGWLENSC